MKHSNHSVIRTPQNRSSSGKPIASLLLAAALLCASHSVEAADGGARTAVTPTAQSAWALYGAGRFVESADAFETVIKSSKPSGRLYYYAALANMKANRRERAKQLCYYVINNFSGNQEAALCKKIFEDDAARTVASAGTTRSNPPKLLTEETLPADFWANLAPDAKSNMHTPAGKLALKRAIDDYNNRLMAHWKAGAVATASGTAGAKLTTNKADEDDDDDELSSTKISMVASKRHKFAIDNSLRIGAYPFSTADIAKDGSNGIDQGFNPNCWFEASMASLADLPRGQRLLASMIKIGGPGTYVVRFPGDGTEYKITEQVMKERHINDRALWASLIECAQVMKFPNNRGAEGESGVESRLAIGLGCITGCKAQSLRPYSTEIQELSAFIGGAISSKNPIVCGTWNASHLGSYEELVVPQHAYTIIGFDPASNMVTIRNPHGSHSDTFSMADDPNHRKFEMKENGVFKMHLALFQKYFNEVCRSFI